MVAKGKSPKATKKTQHKGGKGAKTDKKRQTLSEEDLRKVSGGIEPLVHRPKVT